MKKKRIAILSGGGDCPGINAVIRAVTKKAQHEHGYEVIGIEDGYDGLINNRYRRLGNKDVSGILTLGGTILGTSNTASPYRYPVLRGARYDYHDVSRRTIQNIKKLSITCLVCIGGDGTLSIASRLCKQGVPAIGVPKTIDNDLVGTDITFGFDTAVSIAVEGIDRIHTTAESHDRVMVIELMGRRAGWIALSAGIAGGGDIILIPEIPYSFDCIKSKIVERKKHGKKFSIVVVAEGAKQKGGKEVVQRIVDKSVDPIRLGGIGFQVAAEIEKLTGMETRTLVMGHLLRGGSPTAFDRILATQLGTKAVDLIVDKKFGYMPAIQNGKITEALLSGAADRIKTVPLDHPLIKSARSFGTCFGD